MDNRNDLSSEENQLDEIKFTRHFGISKHQSEIDFVDISLETDMRLFVDPYAITKSDEILWLEASSALVNFFDVLSDRIRKNNRKGAMRLLEQLHEPNEIHFGLSKSSRGRGVGKKRASSLYESFSESEAFSKGFIKNLAETELFVENIGPDIISDITTNVVRKQLIEFTQQQCKKHGIEMEYVAIGPYWDYRTEEWNDDYVNLPVYIEPIILVPKRFAKINTLYNPVTYYRHYILNYLQARYAPQESLGKALVAGKKKITKTELERRFRYSKQFLYKFSIENPHVFNHFKNDRSYVAKQVQSDLGEFGIDIEYMNNRKLMINEIDDEQVISILHLSDLHLSDDNVSKSYLTHLKLDLKKELKVKHLNYIVISGDISNEARESEYEISVNFIRDLAKFAGIDMQSIIAVPGNHDVNWDISKKAYQPNVYSSEEKIPDGKHIAKGSKDEIIDETTYKQRFENYSRSFFEKIYGAPYPLEYCDQIQIREFPENGIVFLCLNSCWEMGHKSQNPSVESRAVSKAIDILLDDKYENLLKIAVLHHPVSGANCVEREFLQLLAVCDFKICMHGHIHEANNDLMRYDVKRTINVIGAGTFGAPFNQHSPGIPFQYNLITYSARKKLIQVDTRKKEKHLGPWCADARWGDKNSPVAQYFIKI